MPEVFNDGTVPVVAVVNEARTALGFELEALVAALQEFVNVHYAPVWGTPCQVVAADSLKDTSWGLVLLDDADQANALGYHLDTPAGLPLAKVFVATTQQDGGNVSVVASHELAEMLADPAVNLGALGPNGGWYALETADAVEESSFTVAGLPMSNFVYPAWFEAFRKPGSMKFDHLGQCGKPFALLKGGYMPVFSRGRWTQVFGSKSAEKKFRAEAHPRLALRRASHQRSKKGGRA